MLKKRVGAGLGSMEWLSDWPIFLPSPVVSSFMSELSPVRAELLGFLTHALLGDSLAAEYLILHLISTV